MTIPSSPLVPPHCLHVLTTTCVSILQVFVQPCDYYSLTSQILTCHFRRLCWFWYSVLRDSTEYRNLYFFVSRELSQTYKSHVSETRHPGSDSEQAFIAHTNACPLRGNKSRFKTSYKISDSSIT